MNFEVKQGEKHQVIIEGEIPVIEMELALKLASKKLSEKVNIPGFRKGKAPQSIIESHIGAQAILDEAAEDVIPRAYIQAVKEHKLEPVANPDIKVNQLEKDKPLLFTATVTVKPEVKLGQYKEVPVEKTIHQVDDNEVDSELEKTRQRAARLVDAAADAKVEEGDNTLIDFTGFIDGEEFPGGKANDFTLEIGSGAFIPGFEEQLVGMAIGEEKDINVAFPEDYHEERYAGKPALFKVKINAIKRKELPELDDSFVQEISETADNMEQLKAELKDKLQKSHDRATEEGMRAKILKAVIDGAEVDIPEVMVDNRIDEIIQDLTYRLESQGLKLEMYMQYAKTDLEKMREQYRPQALANCKMDLVMEAVADAEKLEVGEEELNAQLEIMAASYQQPVEKIKEILVKNGGIYNILSSMRLMKATDLIVSSALVSEVSEESEKPAKAKKTTRTKKAAKATEDGENVEEKAKEE